jgi:PAS domain S-box-containing protein
MKKNTIIIVEDTPLLAKDLQACLERLGYPVAGLSTSGIELFHKLEQTHPDLVLLDAVSLEPTQAVDTVRQLFSTYALPVILLGPAENKDTFTGLFNKEAFGYITQPITDQVLEIAVFTTFSKHQLLLQLRESESSHRKKDQILQGLIAQNPNGICLFDSGGLVFVWNPSMQELTGLSEQEVLGSPIWKTGFAVNPQILQNPGSALPIKEKIQEGLVTGTARWMHNTTECLIHKVGGETVLLESFIFPIQLSDHPLYAVISRDITQRKQAEEKIARQALLANQLVEASQHLNNEFELGKLYQVITRDLSQAFLLGVVGIAIYHPQDELLKFVLINGALPNPPVQYPLTRHHQFIKNDQTIYLIPDIQKIAGGPNFELLQTLDIHNMLVVNLTHKERLIGAIFLGSVGKVYPFNEDELAFLAAYGHHAAAAIDRSMLFEESRQRTEELEILSRLSSSLRQASSRSEMLPILLQEAFAFSRAETGSLYVLGRNNQILESCELNPKGYQAWFQPGEPLWHSTLNDYTTLVHTEFYPPQPETRGQKQLVEKVALLLRSHQSNIGFLVLGFTNPILINATIQRVAQAFADISGNALQRSGLLDMLEQQVFDRTRELSTLFELTLLINSPLTLEQLLKASLDKLLAASEAQAAAVYKYEEPLDRFSLMAHMALPASILPEAQYIECTPQIKVWLQKNPTPRLSFVGSEDTYHILPEKAGFCTSVYVPVQNENTPLGMFCVFWQTNKDISTENISLLRAAAESLGSAIQNRALRQQAEQAAVLEERQRLARELHDSVTQSIYSITLLSEASQDLAAKGSQQKLLDCLRELQQSSVHALREMRLLLFELRPPQDKNLNLAETLRRRLESVERRSGIQVEFLTHGLENLTSLQQEELYQVANEALNNALKHSQTKKILIELSNTANKFIMVIQDQGCGFDPQGGFQYGLGIGNMRERVKQLGGEFKITSSPGQGVQILVTLDL